MMKPNHVTSAIIIFTILTSLYVGLYGSFESVYGITRDGTSCPRIQANVPIDCVEETLTIGEALANTTMISGVYDVRNSLQVFSVPGNILQQSFEVLTGAGLGIVKIFLGFGLFPGQVVSILLQYWYLPVYAAELIGTMLSMYIYFILLRYILKQE